jgi:hypothetical protein
MRIIKGIGHNEYHVVPRESSIWLHTGTLKDCKDFLKKKRDW